jgi:23S rRNA (cytosine1962-C5)-methyltransferase
MRYENLITKSWNDYELLDSGDEMKLERFGQVVLARPETQALWKKGNPELWKSADATFTVTAGKGAWHFKKSTPKEWVMHVRELTVLLKLGNFKHTGIFPEQVPNWEWVRKNVESRTEPKVLNLFGYTGVASLVAAQAGAFVTHVDASKQSLDWANQNATASDMPSDKIRWIAEDALAFVKREVRRGSTYDGIILDPPAFGRGVKGQVWRIEED